MPKRAFLPTAARGARSKLTQIVSRRSFLCGSVVEMKRVCGYAGCKCIVQGKKHKSLYLCISAGGRRKMIYVPSEWEEEIVCWVNAYKEARSLMESVSSAYLRNFMEEKELKGKPASPPLSR